MKKTYISPAFVMVQMSVSRAILTATSMALDSSNTITDSGDILVKESTVSDVNVWDSEW